MSDSPNPPSSGTRPENGDGSDGSGHHDAAGHVRRRRSRRRVTRRAAVPSIAAEEGRTPNAAEQLATQGTRSGGSRSGGSRSHVLHSTASRQHRTGRRGRAASTDTSVTPRRPVSFEQVRVADYPSPEDAPYAAVTIVTNGIHPSTARLIGMAVVLFDASWRVRHEVVFHVNVGEDPGAWHLHGYSPDDLAEVAAFEHRTNQVESLLDGRTLLLHQAAFTWGFITYEFKRARRNTIRRMRSRGNRRGSHGRGNSTADQRVPEFTPPVPTRIVDTLATARSQATFPLDTRLRGVAAEYGLNMTAPPEAMPHIGATASDERAALHPDNLLLADAHLVAALHRAQSTATNTGADATASPTIAELNPADLVADKFGLQRSTIRIEAAEAARMFINPGTWEEGKPLVQGMEFVVSPDIAEAPDELIARGTRAGLAYSEKLNRRSSLVVCNRTKDLSGKAMHADRKDIPLVTDELFLQLIEDVAPGERESRPVKPGAGIRPQTSRLKAPGSATSGSTGSSGSGGSRGGSGRSNRSSRSGRGKGKSNNGRQGRQGQRNRSGRNRSGNNANTSNNTNVGSSGTNSNGQKQDGNRNGRRRRRRGGGGGRSNAQSS